MQVRKISEVEKESAAGPLFTSDDVARQPLAPDSNDFNVSVVSSERACGTSSTTTRATSSSS